MKLHLTKTNTNYKTKAITSAELTVELIARKKKKMGVQTGDETDICTSCGHARPLDWFIKHWRTCKECRAETQRRARERRKG